MACSLYVFSVQVTSVTSDKWARKPVLFCVDTTGVRYTLVVTNYRPYVLVRPNDVAIETFDVETHLADDRLSVDEVHECQMTPLVGFTNNRQDRLFRVYYTNIGDKRRIMKRLDTLDVTVVHRGYSDEMQLLHSTGWTLQSWYTLKRTPRSGRLNTGGVSGNMLIQDLVSLPTPCMPIPPVSYVYIRATIHSSTATPTNLFLPDHTIAKDRVQACELRHGRLDTETDDECTVLSVPGSEAALLREIARWFACHDPCIIVHMSDPFDHLAYLHFRAKRHRCRLGLSSIRQVDCRENLNMLDDSFRDLTCPGREVMDLLCILQKFMISPSLDGYTLPDAFAHPRLIRCKTGLTYSGEEEVTLSPLETRRAFITKELDVLCALQSDNCFIVNNLVLSGSCDLSLFKIVSRGQQARAFACFARTYHSQAIYINHTQFDNPYVLVKRRRADSSFPDPTWIENPPLASLRTTAVAQERPRKRRRHMSVRAFLGMAPKEPTKPKTTKRFGGGFVIDPDAGFYAKPEEAVVTLDFASLYPSIMKGYRVCFMRVCYDRRWLDDDRAEKEYVPLDDETCCVFIKSYDGVPTRSITDSIIHDVMQNRKKVRAQIKLTTDTFVRQSLDAQQLCCKILQNAFYGACGSETFGVPCTAIAASVCMIGQWMNKTVRHQAMIRGGRCVYGDTDSVMIQFPTDPSLTSRDDILRDIYRQGHELEAHTTQMFPAPNAVEFETLKLPHLQTSKKKTYAAHEYPPTAEGWNSKPSELYKGFAFKKRDRCPFVQHAGKALMNHLMSNTLNDAEIVAWVAGIIDHQFTVRPTALQLPEFVITCLLSAEYKQENVLALHLADQYERETGSRPRPGRRLRFVIAAFRDGRKHFQSAVTLATFERDSHQLDAAYYLEKQLLLPMRQILDLRPCLYAAIQRMITQKVAKLVIDPNQRQLPSRYTNYK
mgnify:CR=1 FL=1